MTPTPTTESGIPDIDADVMEKAREAYFAPFRDTLDTADVNELIASIASAIQAAKDEERERCAGKVARKADLYLPGGPFDMKAIFRNLAAEIREAK